MATSGALFAIAAYYGVWMRHHHVVPNQWLQLAGLAAIYTALSFLQRRAIPRLAQVRLVHDGEQLGFPLSSAYDGPTDSLLDAASAASNQRLERP